MVESAERNIHPCVLRLRASCYIRWPLGVLRPGIELPCGTGSTRFPYREWRVWGSLQLCARGVQRACFKLHPPWHLLIHLYRRSHFWALGDSLPLPLSVDPHTTLCPNCWDGPHVSARDAGVVPFSLPETQPRAGALPQRSVISRACTKLFTPIGHQPSYSSPSLSLSLSLLWQPRGITFLRC